MYVCNGSLSAAPRWLSNSCMRGGHTNKEARWLQPLVSVTSATLWDQGSEVYLHSIYSLWVDMERYIYKILQYNISVI